MSSGREDHHLVSDRARPARLKLKPSEVCTARTAVRANECRGRDDDYIRVRSNEGSGD